MMGGWVDVGEGGWVDDGKEGMTGRSDICGWI